MQSADLDEALAKLQQEECTMKEEKFGNIETQYMINYEQLVLAKSNVVESNTIIQLMTEEAYRDQHKPINSSLRHTSGLTIQ